MQNDMPLRLEYGSSLTGTSTSGNGVQANQSLIVTNGTFLSGNSVTGDPLSGQLLVLDGGLFFENQPIVNPVVNPITMPVLPEAPMAVIEPVNLSPVIPDPVAQFIVDKNHPFEATRAATASLWQPQEPVEKQHRPVKITVAADAQAPVR